MKESWWVSQPSSIHCSRVQYSWCQNYAEIWKALLKVTQLQKAVLSFSFVSFAGCFFFFFGGGDTWHVSPFPVEESNIYAITATYLVQIIL